MLRESLETPAIVENQRQLLSPVLDRLVPRLQAAAPRAVVTLGRGSSDHASMFARFLIETHCGVLCSSLQPSLGSVYKRMPDLSGVVVLAFSQSGRSPDLLQAARAAQASGAVVVAIVNDESSPLAALADEVMPTGAGAEVSVAATKTHLTMLTAIAALVARWTSDPLLDSALADLPEVLAAAASLDWSQGVPLLSGARNLYVLGRGAGLACAEEAALKLKEVCGLHAEAFSPAELRHGPLVLVEPGFPVLIFAQADAARAGMEETARDLATKGATVLYAGPRLPSAGITVLPTIDTHPTLQPVVSLQSFYGMASALAQARHRDPDHPPHLTKVTETL